MNNRPIGIFDSGLGGLTVFKEVRKLLPHEDIVYFGDTARVPYGTKSKETVIKFSVENTDFLIGLNVKMIVVACNTSSSFSLPVLKRRCGIPVLGVIRPGALEAARVTKNMKVGVIGTRATVSSGVYEREIKKIDPDIRVTSGACPLFVPLVEEGWLEGDIAERVAAQYLAPFKRKKIDAIILGCTHYPLLKHVIRGVLGKSVMLVDSATQTALAVKDVLVERGIYNRKIGKGKCRFYVSDEPLLFKKIGSKFIGSRISNVKKVDVGA